MPSPAVYGVMTKSVAAALTPIAGIPPIVRRRKPKVFKIDGSSIVLVCPGKQGEKIKSQQFEKMVVWRYPILVALVLPGNDLQETTLDAHLLLRETVRNTLFQPLTGPFKSDVFDFGIDAGAAAELQAELGTSFEVDAFTMWYESAEERM
jgi:hypothetical protein